LRIAEFDWHGTCFALLGIEATRGVLSMDLPKTVLCPVDFSPESLRAGRKAAILTRAMGAKLLLLHVIELPAPAGLTLIAPPPTQLVAEHERRMRHRLGALAKELAQQHGVQAEIWLTAGAVHELIVRAAKERDAILIVMGRGARGMRLLGSVADRVVLKAPCPIIVCPRSPEEAHAGAVS
jgi:nucleotide-binding universal stress UspA family protein